MCFNIQTWDIGNFLLSKRIIEGQKLTQDKKYKVGFFQAQK